MSDFLFQFDIDDERICQAVHTGTTLYTKVWKHFKIIASKLNIKTVCLIFSLMEKIIHL